MSDVVIKDVHFVTTDRSVAEAICMRLQRSKNAFLGDVGSNIKIFEFRIRLVLRQEKRVLLNQIFFFLLLSFACFEPFLHFFDEPECRVQIGRWRRQLTGFLNVRASVSATSCGNR